MVDGNDNWIIVPAIFPLKFSPIQIHQKKCCDKNQVSLESGPTKNQVSLDHGRTGPTAT